jgi:hypothetical protein
MQVHLYRQQNYILSKYEQGGIRTPDLLIRSQKLYPLSYLSWCVSYNNIAPSINANKFFS